MHLISRKKPRDFSKKHPASKSAIEAWIRVVAKTEWENFAQLRQTFGSVDRVGQFYVFNIGGNKYRIITAIHFNRGKLFVRHVLTHAEYDQDKWKDD